MALGEFTSHETILQCPHDKTVFHAEELKALVAKQCKFGFDVLCYVGRSVFIDCRTEKDVIHELQARNIRISRREISNLAMRFVIYLAIAHREAISFIMTSSKKVISTGLPAR